MCNSFDNIIKDSNFTCQNNDDIASKKLIYPLQSLSLPSVKQCYYSTGTVLSLTGNYLVKPCPTTTHQSCIVLKKFIFNFVFI